MYSFEHFTHDANEEKPDSYASGYGIIIGREVPEITDEFLRRLAEIARELGANPKHMLNVMASESGIDSSIRNPHGGATGLIQFMPFTQKGLGYPGTPEEFAEMGMVPQLEYVRKYYLPYKGKLGSAVRLYHVTFFPRTLGRTLASNDADDTALVARDSTDPQERKAYEWNPVLDSDKDGVISVGDMKRFLANSARTSRYTNAAKRLDELGGGRADFSRDDSPPGPGVVPVSFDSSTNEGPSLAIPIAVGLGLWLLSRKG